MKDIAGQPFDRLTAIAPTGERTANGQYIWLCICVCGNYIPVREGNLQSGNTRSCGCLQHEARVKRGIELGTHGRPAYPDSHRWSDTPEYKTYTRAKQRCTNPNNDAYPWYGGRPNNPIKFLFNSFEEWYAELGEKPEPKELYSVDRIDPNLHYMVGNVRWSTKDIQNQNRRYCRAA